MKINKITPQLFSTQRINSKTQNNNNSQQTINYSYNPIAYQDYNINFTARLFRTPANFYEQPFNQSGMPETMKNYLFDDYEDRQNMPPAQMMKLVFDDINIADNIKDVKELYPDEPLFKNLKDAKDRKSRSGVLAEIAVMKQPDKTLFKNGKDDLGLYLVKKIYLEGKTLKEINKDFEKDISVYYKGLSPIQYETLSAYGIKYPNSAFWKSFTATREDFPYEYKPRKAVSPRATSIHTTNSTPQHRIEKKKFDDVKDWEIDKIADAMVKGKGNSDETKKRLRKSNIRDNESLNFVAKYMGEINSIVLDRMHVSDEMKSYFNSPDKMNKTQQEKFTNFWQNPEMNKLQSVLMKDTIKLFFNEYGADGNNEDFQSLLEYAHTGIKEERKLPFDHDEKQVMYEELFKDFEEEETNITPKSSELPVEENIDIPKNPKLIIRPTTHEVIFDGDLQQTFIKNMEPQLKFLPDAFSKKYMNYFTQHPKATDKYLFSVVAEANIPEEYKDTILSSEEMDKITLNINEDFTKKFPFNALANNQALSETVLNMYPSYNKAAYAKMLALDTFRIIAFIDKLGIKDFTPEQKARLNQKYHEYMTPIKSKDEINKINNMLVDYVTNFDENKAIYQKGSELNALGRLLAANIKDDPLLKKEFARELKYSKFVENYGGTPRILLDDNISDEVKQVKLQLMLEDFVTLNTGRLDHMFCSNAKNLDLIMRYDFPQLYNILKSQSIEMGFGY